MLKRIKTVVAVVLCVLLLLPQTESFAQEEGFVWEVPQEAVLAGLMEADIRSVHEAYAAGILTCSQLTGYYLQRINAYNDTYNCFITLCDDAMDQAAEIDKRMAAGDREGLLFGIPLVIKDNIDYKGYHTTNGYKKQSSQIAKSNAQIVDYLLSEGAVILGKTNMSTAAQDARASYSEAAGETKNAYNPYLASGGSSGGSAVATSLNFAMAGLGTDTNSSLRLPAVLNGCLSLRVTWNSLPVDGIIDLNCWRDVPGVITRTVEDQAIILDVLSGGKSAYAKNLDSNALDGLRLGIIKELAYPRDSVDQEVKDAFETAVKELESCGAEIVQVSVPGVEDWIVVYDDTKKFRQEKQAQIQGIMKKNEISAFLFPTYLSPPQYSGKDAQGVYWDTGEQPFLNNARMFSSNVEIPEIGIPIGYHSRGAGIGMEIAAGKNQEQLLLNIAYSYLRTFDHRQAPQGASNLYASWYQGTLEELTRDYYFALAKYSRTPVPTETEETTAAPSSEEVPHETLTAPTEEQTEPNPIPTQGAIAPEILPEGKLYKLWILWVLLPVCAVPLVVTAGIKRKRRQKKHKYLSHKK